MSQHRLKKITDQLSKKESKTLISVSSASELYDKLQDNLTTKKYDNLTGGWCKQKNETNGKNRFVGKLIIITGGGGNFGSAMAYRMASEGCNVIIWDIVDASKVVNKIQDKYPNVKCTSYKVDVTNEEIVKKTCNDIYNKYGRIDYLFNNAGYQGDFIKLQDYDVKNFRKVIDINLTGVFIVLKYVSNIMKKQYPQGGVIVNTASMAGTSPPPNMVAYAASKAGVQHLTKVASKDLAECNIRCNSISPAFIGPGFMWTRQIELQAKANSQYYSKDPSIVAEQMINSTPLRRYGSIDEVIGVVTCLLSDDFSYVTGMDIEITGGMN